jgi:hypothetical protein
VLKPGETGFTNLIRSGDTIERITQWQNDGEFSFRDFTITNIDQAGVAKAVSVFLADNATTLHTLAPDSGDGPGKVAEIRTTFMVSGQAGSVLDTSKLGFQLDAFGGYHWDTSKMDLFQQKNLITFQGDLNYDGAVTMKDLAFLNAGAARGSDDARGYSRDVDANFDGELDIDDLAILDADWAAASTRVNPNSWDPINCRWQASQARDNSTGIAVPSKPKTPLRPSRATSTPSPIQSAPWSMFKVSKTSKP